jgi:glutathione synthase/RimK-type ligase-like ATP-grasp enzyme
MYRILTSNIPLLVISQFEFIDYKDYVKPKYNFSNIDLAFNYEGEFDYNILRRLIAYGIPIIGGPRLQKQEQAVIMERMSFNHPKSYFNRITCEPFKHIQEFDSYVDIDEFVVKPVSGARGIGVKKITRADYKKCLENHSEIGKIFK